LALLINTRPSPGPDAGDRQRSRADEHFTAATAAR
jgi:hypothetical protein